MRRKKRPLSAGTWNAMRRQELPEAERRPEPSAGSYRHTMADHLTTPASRGAVLGRLLRERGGHLLVVGGKLDEFVPTPLLTHPQVRLWDTDTRNWERRELPSNTRAVLFNRWVNHALMRSISAEAKRLRCIIFPMLQGKEIRETLAEAFNIEEPKTVTPKEEAAVIEQATKETEAVIAEPPPRLEDSPPTLPEPVSRRRAKLGEIAAFLVTELGSSYPQVKELPEYATATRLLPKLHAIGVEQNVSGLAAQVKAYKGLLQIWPKHKPGPGLVVFNAMKTAMGEAPSQTNAVAGGSTPPPRSIAAETQPKAVLAGPSERPFEKAGIPEVIGDVDFDSVEQLFRNAIKSLKDVLPAIEKAREVLPALELVQGELPKVKREIARLKKIREAMK